MLVPLAESPLLVHQIVEVESARFRWKIIFLCKANGWHLRRNRRRGSNAWVAHTWRAHQSSFPYIYAGTAMLPAGSRLSTGQGSGAYLLSYMVFWPATWTTAGLVPVKDAEPRRPAGWKPKVSH